MCLLNLFFSTTSATQLVLKAHKEAVSSLGGTSSATAGTITTVVNAANSAARDSTKEVEAAMKISMRNALGGMLSSLIAEVPMDDLTIMKVYSIHISSFFTLQHQRNY